MRDNDLEFVAVFEWSSDYRCRKCGVVFNVQDDSDARFRPNYGHRCTTARVPEAPDSPGQESL